MMRWKIKYKLIFKTFLTLFFLSTSVIINAEVIQYFRYTEKQLFTHKCSTVDELTNTRLSCYDKSKLKMNIDIRFICGSKDRDTEDPKVLFKQYIPRSETIRSRLYSYKESGLSHIKIKNLNSDVYYLLDRRDLTMVTKIKDRRTSLDYSCYLNTSDSNEIEDKFKEEVKKIKKENKI